MARRKAPLLPLGEVVFETPGPMTYGDQARHIASQLRGSSAISSRPFIELGQLLDDLAPVLDKLEGLAGMIE
ncbi:hypothetical protein SAMN05892883_2087 [Jatrophihabitans sp. GAS493]|uniref:hypothetical protein n=1 Tax=Jatrophihabitans sp. GAS493 TaxID=1907575 RepID=UPI000BB715E8|nr:hypothetical protein [Jatrophihabitans sp. GAS493]SOD72740.1 hypothetical protein SAMN05892883_2087 [Jatrophihabitans sp. GAS493]